VSNGTAIRRADGRLQEVLEPLAGLEPIAYSEFVTELADEFGRSKRTAGDSLAVLRRACYVEVDGRPAARATGRLIETGRRYYRVSERGHYVLGHPEGPSLLRIARKLFTTVPSPNVRRFRDGLIARDGSAEAALLRFEREMLKDPRKTRTLGQTLLSSIDWTNPWAVWNWFNTLADLGLPAFAGKRPPAPRLPTQ
jgi:hypothetical protein